MSRPLRLAVNPRLIDKNAAGDKRLFVEGFENQSLSIEQLAEHIKLGPAFTAELNGQRRTASFVASDVVAVDIDRGMCVEQVLAHPLVAAHAGLVHTTVSHAPEAPRLRIVFPLATTITDPREMRAIQRSLALRLGGDLSATDPTRIFFGNRNAQTWVFPDRELSVELMEELIAQSINPPAPDNAVGGVLAGVRSALKVDPSQLIRLANGMVLPFAQVPGKTPVFCPYHADEHASAFIVTSERGVNGLRCSTCLGTYWPLDGADDFDFRHFDHVVRRAYERFSRQPDRESLGPFFYPPAARTNLLGCNIVITDQEPAPSELLRGLTLIKASKGSGKTEALKGLIAGARTVLLIGHRRSLIRQSCKRLKLSCYLDAKGHSSRLGVCLDSLHLAPSNYDVVILDECEQLLAHFLADTIEQRRGGGRESLFKKFCAIVSQAKFVVALDADLGWVTLNTLSRMMAHTMPDPVQGDLFDRNRAAVRLWLNESKTGRGLTIQVYRSKPHLIAELMQAAADGKRIFVTSNSKTLVNRIAAMIAERLPHVRQIVITADTVAGEAQKTFLEDAQAQALNYDVILTSPAVGTGVDISFPDKARLIDAVFGFCEADIYTHLDFDQQLARVRDPGAVMAWINPRRFNYETSVDAVRRELLENAMFKSLLIDLRGPGGTARYAEDDPLIEMAALIICQQRASKNALCHHFIAHKQEQGYAIEFIEPDNEVKTVGLELLKAGRDFDNAKYRERMLAAAPLRSHDFDRVSDAIGRGEGVSDDEWASLHRTKIELFYRQPITENLLEIDARGRWRKRFNLLNAVERAAGGQIHDWVGVARHMAEQRAATGLIPAHQPIIVEQMQRLVAGRNLDRGHEQLDRRAKFIRDSDETATAITRLLQFTPVMRGAAWNADVVFDGDQLAEFARFAKENKAALENLLGIEIRRDLASKPMSQLKSVLSLIGLDLLNAGTTKIDGRKLYRYRLDGEALRRIKTVQAARERTTAWRFMAELHGWPADEADAGDETEDAA